MGIKIRLTPSKALPCKKKENEVIQNYTVTYHLSCDENLDHDKHILEKVEVHDTCKYDLYFRTYGGCPTFNLYAVWNFLLKFKVIFGTILIVQGLFFFTLGAKLVIVTLFTVCVLLVVGGMFFIFFVVLFTEASPVFVWVILVLSLILGVGLGYFVAKYKKGAFGLLLGGYMGFILGVLLYNLLFVKITWAPTAVFWFTIIGCVIICFLFAYFMFDHIIILSTSFTGGYSFVRGISLFAGGFPNESLVIDAIKRDELEQLSVYVTWKLYLYILGWVMITGLSIWFQYHIRTEEDKERAKENKTTNESLDGKDKKLYTEESQ